MKLLLLLALLLAINLQPATGQCLAPIDEPSEMPANPKQVNGIFNFDYKIISEVEIKTSEGIERLEMDYYVNTNDGSIYFPSGFMLANYDRTENRKGRYDGSVWMANGQMVNYLYDKENDVHRAMTIETGNTSEDVFGEQYLSMLEFFRRLDDMTGPPDPLPDSFAYGAPTVAYAGRISNRPGTKENIMTVHFDSRPTTIKTSRPVVGFFVGIVKDVPIAKCNRLAVFVKAREVGHSYYIQAELKKIYAENASFDGSLYKPLRMGGTRGTDIQSIMADFKARMLVLSERKDRLEEQQDACGRNADCRDRYQRQIDEVKEDMQRAECEMARGVGLDDAMAACD